MTLLAPYGWKSLEHERIENSVVPMETGIRSETTSEPEDLKSNAWETAVRFESLRPSLLMQKSLVKPDGFSVDGEAILSQVR